MASISEMLKKHLFDDPKAQEWIKQNRGNLTFYIKNIEPFMHEMQKISYIGIDLSADYKEKIQFKFAGIPIIEDPNMPEGQIILKSNDFNYFPPQHVNCRNIEISTPEGQVISRADFGEIIHHPAETWTAKFELAVNAKDQKPLFKAIFKLGDFTMTKNNFPDAYPSYDIPINEFRKLTTKNKYEKKLTALRFKLAGRKVVSTTVERNSPQYVQYMEYGRDPRLISDDEAIVPEVVELEYLFEEPIFMMEFPAHPFATGSTKFCPACGGKLIKGLKI